MLTCSLVTLAVLLAPAEAQRRKRPNTYHGGGHPHDGHTRADDEFYPGHRQNENYPHIAAKHSHHEILTAALHCDEAKIKELLKAGVPIDFPHDDHGDTALIFASMDHTYANSTSHNCVQLLLDRGADVERADHEGYTPLMWAARVANPKIITLLIHAGASIDRVVKKGADRGLAAIDFARRSKCSECEALLSDPPSREAALAARRRRAERMLSAATSTFSSYLWSFWAYWTGGWTSGDECLLHRALDLARETPGVDPALVEAAAKHRGPLKETLLDLLEKRHLCEQVAPYLIEHRIHSLQELSELSLPLLAHKSQLEPFEAHMLEMAIKKEITRLDREKRAQERIKQERSKEEEQKEELRRLSEQQPCGQQ